MDPCRLGQLELPFVPAASLSEPLPLRERRLPADHPRRSFEALLDTVESRYGDLLSSGERELVAAYRGCSPPARGLWVRLASRRSPLLRRRELAGYADVPDVDAAADELARAALIDDAPELAPAALVALLRGGEPAQLALALAGRRTPRGLRAAREALARVVPEAVLGPALRALVAPLRVRGTDVLRVLRLLFFGSPDADLSAFVQRDLGIVRWEAYALSRERRFRSRTEVEAALDLAALLACDRDALRRPEGVATVLAWRQRLLAEPDLAPPLGSLVARLDRRLGPAATVPAPIGSRPARCPPPRVDDLVVSPIPGCSVERLAAGALAAAGRPAFFAENALWSALFGLLFWDVLFSPAPGAFEHPFQLGPVDLFGPELRRRREAAFAARFDELAAGAWPGARLLDVWDRKQGTANALVSWTPATRSLVELAAMRIPPAHLAVVLERISRDPGSYLRGLPDLLVVTCMAPGYALLEVKGPGDALRAEQRAWLAHLAAAGLPAAVLRVRWSSPPALPRRVARGVQAELALAV